MSRTNRNKKFEQRKEILDGLKKSRIAGSRLDDYEMDDEGDVYDLVDDESYARIVEERRKADEFVVDDNGCGYRDDGEEVLGVREDEYEAKKRGNLADDDDYHDDGTKKKLQRLHKAAASQDGSQANAMFNFVRTGQSSLLRPSAALKTSTQGFGKDFSFIFFEIIICIHFYYH